LFHIIAQHRPRPRRNPTWGGSTCDEWRHVSQNSDHGFAGCRQDDLATILAARLNAAHFNADEVRRHINKDLGFSAADRVEHARRMGWLCDQVINTKSLKS
jgi:hypothetical protein